jgi:hypothetical protein
MKPILTIGFVICAMIASGCKEPGMEETPRFTEISIKSYPKGGGYADKVVEGSGMMYGHHFSGDRPPRVHRSEGHMTQEDMRALRLLVAEVKGKDTTTKSLLPKDDYNCIVISYDDTTSVTLAAKARQKLAPGYAQAIWDLLYKYNVGAW